MKHLILILSLLWISMPTFAQKEFLKDDTAQKKTKIIIDKIYNYEFSEAGTLTTDLKEDYKDHPLYYVLRAISIYHQFSSSEDIEKDKRLFELYLTKAKSLASTILESDEENVEGVFFKMVSHGYLALMYSEQGELINAIDESKKAYKLMKLGFKLKEEYNEFYFACGMYNYYTVQYPETHPVIKPFMAFFKDADKYEGLKQLKIASKEATFTKAEALNYLTHINLKYEDNAEAALPYATQLITQYPNNTYFQLRYTEALLATKNYNKALSYIEKLKKSPLPKYSIDAEAFYAIYLEGKGKQAEAKTVYVKAINLINKSKKSEKEYRAHCYIGLARIYTAEGKEDAAEKYYKKAKSSEYENIRKEAEAGLK